MRDFSYWLDMAIVERRGCSLEEVADMPLIEYYDWAAYYFDTKCAKRRYWEPLLNVNG